MKKKTKLIIEAVIVVIAVIAGSLGAYLGYFKPHKEAVDAYNVVVAIYKKRTTSWMEK